MKLTLFIISILLLPQILFSVEPLEERPNIIVLLTDQERHPMHPEGWVEKNLTSQVRLMKHGLAYKRAYTAACMCSPSRALILTSQFSTINQVSKTLDGSGTSTVLPSKEVLGNLAVLIQEKTDYDVVWKGKWHLSYAADGAEK